jgi:hypothetical protein
VPTGNINLLDNFIAVSVCFLSTCLLARPSRGKNGVAGEICDSGVKQKKEVKDISKYRTVG